MTVSDSRIYTSFSLFRSVRPRPTGRPIDRPTDIPSSNHDMISESDFPRPVHLPRHSTLFASLSRARHAVSVSLQRSSSLGSLFISYITRYYAHFSRFPPSRSRSIHIIPSYFILVAATGGRGRAKLSISELTSRLYIGRIMYRYGRDLYTKKKKSTNTHTSVYIYTHI